MVKKLFRLALMALVALFAVKAPPMIAQELGTDYLRQWRSPQISEWKGVITVYCVYDEARFDISTLMSAIKQFEKENKGVFVQYRTMNAASVAQKQQIYGSPDVWVINDNTADGNEENVLSIPVEEENNVLTEEFEFDVDEEEKQHLQQYNRFIIKTEETSEAIWAADEFCTTLRDIVKSDEN